MRTIKEHIEALEFIQKNNLFGSGEYLGDLLELLKEIKND